MENTHYQELQSDLTELISFIKIDYNFHSTINKSTRVNVSILRNDLEITSLAAYYDKQNFDEINGDINTNYETLDIEEIEFTEVEAAIFVRSLDLLKKIKLVLLVEHVSEGWIESICFEYKDFLYHLKGLSRY